jgi:endonuclease V-like protein UPF0215 family
MSGAADRAATASRRRSPTSRRRPHLLGVDDGAFDKHRDRDVPLVGVVTEGADLVEGVAVTRFPVDGADATGFLAGWVGGLRFRPGLQGLVLGGITIAGLGVVDVPSLAEALGLPVLIVNRRDPSDHRLGDALRAAGLEDRLSLVSRCPPAFWIEGGPWVACAGIDPPRAASLVEAARRKSDLPEALRLAHLVARAVATGESRGRV